MRLSELRACVNYYSPGNMTRMHNFLSITSNLANHSVRRRLSLIELREYERQNKRTERQKARARASVRECQREC